MRTLQLVLVLAFALFLVAVACIAGLLVAVYDPNERLMSDDELITLFHNERASFDSLVTMFDEDPWIKGGDSYGYYLGSQSRGMTPAELAGLPHRIPEERWATYERLLRRVHCGRNVWIDSTHVLLQQYVEKMAPNPDDHWMRGYWYARVPVRGKVLTTDLVADPTYRPPPSQTIRYRPLGGGWYIYSDHGYTD